MNAAEYRPGNMQKGEKGISRAANVLSYYSLCNKLKDVIRTGWKDWNVKRERVESIAEHVFGVQMLAKLQCIPNFSIM